MHADASNKAREGHPQPWNLHLNVLEATANSCIKDGDREDSLEDEASHGLSHQIDHVFFLAELPLLHLVSLLFSECIHFGTIWNDFERGILHVHKVVHVFWVQSRYKEHRVDAFI